MVIFSRLNHFGRLGNQLFQIASTIGIAKQNHIEFAFPEWQYAEYFENPLPEIPKLHFKTYKQKRDNFYRIYLDEKIHWDLIGYYQSELFFQNSIQTILHFFTPAKKVVEYIDKHYSSFFQYTTCSIHVRRGDYLEQPLHFPVQPIEYYQKAMNLLSNVDKYIILSDDIGWCRQHFIGSQFVFIDNESDIIDLFLMSKCNYHIISNSSFSWWGAWLNRSQNKRVLCPDKWFGPAKEINWRFYRNDIFIPTFEKIKVYEPNYSIVKNVMIYILSKIYYFYQRIMGKIEY